MDVCLVVRVHDRVADLRVCLDAVRRHWRRHRYHVVVASNGRAAGHPVPPDLAGSVQDVVECDTAPGHVAGAGALLRAAIPRVPPACAYTVLLEADAWVHTDAVLDRYLQRMAATGAVWASAVWVEKYGSLAVDVAVAQSALLRDRAGLLDFTAHAERHVAAYLAAHRLPALHLREHMPVHVPAVLRPFCPEPRGRFRSFPDGALVTHHVEDLPGGIVEKMQRANATLGRREYDVADPGDLARAHRRLVWRQRIARLAPRSAWFRQRRSPEAAAAGAPGGAPGR